MASGSSFINTSSMSKFSTDVQQTIRSQSYGRKEALRKKSLIREKMIANKYISKDELDEFFNRTNDQITRITSKQGSNPIANTFQLRQSPKLNGKKITSADICSLASHVADKMSQSKQKVNLVPIRGCRLPSTTYGDEGDLKKISSIRKGPIRLVDILSSNDHSKQRSSSYVSNLFKTRAILFPQRQNTTFKSNFDKARQNTGVSDVDHIAV